MVISHSMQSYSLKTLAQTDVVDYIISTEKLVSEHEELSEVIRRVKEISFKETLDETTKLLDEVVGIRESVSKGGKEPQPMETPTEEVFRKIIREELVRFHDRPRKHELTSPGTMPWQKLKPSEVWCPLDQPKAPKGYRLVKESES
ncbi:hypothetical protein CDL15_Pgr000012 [Punica granatum]|uniref:Uncharacterized protein n=1 Tax=Punica granatum TaxID=22663 RepID=A0A218VQI6_PUNGR|nr:hypothetical protein CDL15_Pgr000012 [Punica granatum]